jgi:hypothetical protein
MKKLLLITFIAFGINANAQITLIHTYDTAATIGLGPNNDESQLMVINFEISGERYVKINRWGKVIEIYDLNHSLIKTISLATFPLNSNNQVGDILYLSENLFNTDGEIEFMYIYTPSLATITNIYKEDGSLIFSDTADAAIKINFEQQQYPIYNTSQGTIMILSYPNGQAKVFSLPGTLPAGMEDENNKLMAMQSNVSNPYPNPNNGSTKIDYTLPPGANEGEIVFYSLQGNEVKRFKVDRTFNTLLISTKDIAAGTYYYQLQTAGESSGGKKMVVIK